MFRVISNKSNRKIQWTRNLLKSAAIAVTMVSAGPELLLAQTEAPVLSAKEFREKQAQKAAALKAEPKKDIAPVKEAGKIQLTSGEKPSTKRLGNVKIQTAADMVQEVAPIVAAPGKIRPSKAQNVARFQVEEVPVVRSEAAAPAPGPFQVIEDTGEMSVMVRRSKLLRTKSDVYRVATVDESICEVVQFTPRELSIIGKSQGATHVTFWFDDPKADPVTYLVKVTPDVAEVKKVEDAYKLLEDVINEMYPDSKITLSVVADKVIVKGQAKDSEEAFQIITLIRGQGGNGNNMGGGFGGGGFGGSLNEGIAAPVLSDSAVGNNRRSNLQVINMLRVPGVQQVALRVKIAELNRTAARNFGASISGEIPLNGNTNGAAMFLNAITGTSGQTAPTLLTRFDGDNIQVGMNLLQQQGVIKLLGEPTLVTMSGRPATFIAGGEFAVPTIVGSAGLNAVTTDFRAYGAIISFLPTVVDKDRIRLEVSPEFSQINANLTVNNIPGLRTRSATTTVEMREGQSLAIAGLLEDSMTGNSSGDIPFLAQIFGKRSMQRSETELLILVSPELVHPMDAEEVPPLPGFDVQEPNNKQFFFKGQLEGNPTQDYRSTVWPRLKKRYGSDGPAMTSGPFGHGK